MMENCRICPRECKVNRMAGEKGYCRIGSLPVVARSGLHYGEEPCISGERGSGVVFFSGCNLRCVFCQNHKISHQPRGRECLPQELAEIYLKLQEKGAHNLNLVTAVHCVPQVVDSLKIARQRGFNLPVVYNSSGYEKVETLRLLEGWVDVYLPDLKYYSDDCAVKYSSAPDYFKWASAAVKEMHRQVGDLKMDEQGMVSSGLIIRHLLLPGHLEDARKIIRWISRSLSPGVWVSLMSQYTPVHRASQYEEINRSISSADYDQLLEDFLETGLINGFFQEVGSASRRYIPSF